MTIHKKKSYRGNEGKSTGIFFCMVKAVMGIISVILIVLIYGVAIASILM